MSDKSQASGAYAKIYSAAASFFLSQAPWSALAAVGRGASGEKTMSLVRTNDRLYRAKVKHYGLRSVLGDVVKG